MGKVGGKYIEINMVEPQVGLIVSLSSPMAWKRADALAKRKQGVLFLSPVVRLSITPFKNTMLSLCEGIAETSSHVFL